VREDGSIELKALILARDVGNEEPSREEGDTSDNESDEDESDEDEDEDD
jgi:hypothetical protein